MSNFTGTSVGHRGHAEVVSDARQAWHTHSQLQDVHVEPSQYAFDLPQHLHTFRAPDRPTSAPAIIGVDEFENPNSPMPLHPDRVERMEQIRQMKKRERETRNESTTGHEHTGPSAHA